MFKKYWTRHGQNIFELTFNILQRLQLWWKMVWSFAADKFTGILWFEPRWTHFWCPHSMAKRCTMLRKITGQFFLWISRRGQKFALQTWIWPILTWTFLLWHSLSSTYFCCTQLSFSQFSPGITQPQLSLTLHNFATHTSALAYFCLSSVFYLKLES